MGVCVRSRGDGARVPRSEVVSLDWDRLGAAYALGYNASPVWNAHRPVCAELVGGMRDLRHRVTHALAAAGSDRDAPAITNVRHAHLLRQARTALARAAAAAAGRAPEELVAADLGEARRAIEEVTGARPADAVLTAIFTTFCICT